MVSIAAAIGFAQFFFWRQRPVLPRSHSHNDYYQRHPLLSALRYGFVSVKADVWPVGDELLVGHDRVDLDRSRTFRRLYLAPLADRIRKFGTVLPGLTEPFQLLVEIKDNPQTAYQILDAQLREFDWMLTRYESTGQGDVTLERSVTVILTGRCPREAMTKQQIRYAACDGRLSDVGSGITPTMLPLCSDDWRWHFAWNGHGPMPQRPRRARRAVWRDLAQAGVDYLGADYLRSLHRFLRNRP